MAPANSTKKNLTGPKIQGMENKEKESLIILFGKKIITQRESSHLFTVSRKLETALQSLEVESKQSIEYGEGRCRGAPEGQSDEKSNLRPRSWMPLCRLFLSLFFPFLLVGFYFRSLK
jgi:hypothetical protein